MSGTPNPDLEKRLAALEQGKRHPGASTKRRSPLLAILMVGLILASGAVLYLFSQPEEEVAVPTATPDEFQLEGDGFGEIEPFVPPPSPCSSNRNPQRSMPNSSHRSRPCRHRSKS